MKKYLVVILVFTFWTVPAFGVDTYEKVTANNEESQLTSVQVKKVSPATTETVYTLSGIDNTIYGFNNKIEALQKQIEELQSQKAELEGVRIMVETEAKKVSLKDIQVK
jgi:hypothetical protein